MSENSKLILEHNNFINEIEQNINQEIAELYSVTSRSVGMVIENRKIIYLSLYDLGLDKLPNSFGNLTTLRKLYLGKNNLMELPRTIGNLMELQLLDVKDNELVEIPYEIGNLENLRELNLKNNKLKYIPNSINNLLKIEKILIDGNSMLNELELPDKVLSVRYKLKSDQVRAFLSLEGKIIKKISNYHSRNGVYYLKTDNEITTLSLQNCNLRELPVLIKEFKGLKSLNLGKNKLKKLPEFIFELKNLEYLDLHKNEINKLSFDIQKLEKLRGVSLYGNIFQKVPKSIDQIENLDVLDIRNNKIKRIEINKETFKKLSHFEFVGNPIEKIPTCMLKSKYNLNSSDSKALWYLENNMGIKLTKLTNITNIDIGYKIRDNRIIELSLYDCNLKNFPKILCKLTYLEKLFLRGNFIKEIPKYIEFFKKLKILDISINNIQNVSENIGKLSEIEEIFLNNNSIINFPRSISWLPNLKKLYIQENNISHISDELDGIKNQHFKIKIDWLKIQQIPDSIVEEITGLCFNDFKAKIILEDYIHKKIAKLESINHSGVGYFEESGFIIYLSLENLRISHLGNVLSFFKNLKFLNLANNNLNNISDIVNNLYNIKKLDLKNNEIEKISLNSENLKSLEWLDLSNNKIRKIGSLIEIRKLKYLNLNNNQIKKIPDIDSKHIFLEEIYLKGNPIKVLPNTLSDIKKLKNIEIDWNKLNFIKEGFLKFRYKLDENQALFFRDIKEYTKKELLLRENIRFNTRGYKIENGKIIELCLYNCKLKKLPPTIGNLEHLEKLYLNSNQLKELPREIRNLTRLDYLNLKNNNFQNLPPEIYYLSNLKIIKTDGNDWDIKCYNVIKKGIFSIRDYCKEILTIDIFLSHKVIENQKFHIEEVADFLRKKDQIDEVYYCEENLSGNIDDFMKKYIIKSDLLVFFGSQISIYNSEDCRNEINLAKKNNKLIIPIKGEDIEWKYFSKVGLNRIKGIVWQGNNDISDFLNELYDEIIKLKRDNAEKIV